MAVDYLYLADLVVDRLESLANCQHEPVTCRYRHGWIPIIPSVGDSVTMDEKYNVTEGVVQETGEVSGKPYFDVKDKTKPLHMVRVWPEGGPGGIPPTEGWAPVAKPLDDKKPGKGKSTSVARPPRPKTRQHTRVEAIQNRRLRDDVRPSDSLELDNLYTSGVLFDAGGNVKFTPEESEIIDLYTNDDTVNSWLRADQKISKADFDVEVMDKAIRRHQLTENTKLFRGMDPSYLGNVEPGDVLHDKGYLSTSIDPENTRVFGNTMLIIDAPAGTPAGWTGRGATLYSQELEAILPRDTQVKITSIDGNKFYGELVKIGDQSLESVAASGNVREE